MSSLSVAVVQMSRRRYGVLLAGCMLVAAMMRLWLWADQGTAWMIHAGDEDEYYRGAVHLVLDGTYYDEGQWLRPPMTSLFLAAVFALVGINIPLAMLVQCGISVATVWLLATLTRSVLHSRRAALAAALAAALFLPYASYANQMLSETLFIFFTMLALLLFEIARVRAMRWQWLVAGGIVWAMATLTRPVGLYAVPLLALWAMWATWHHTQQQQQQHTTRALITAPTLLIVGFVLVLAPWSIRNYMVYHQLVLVDTNGGVSFWLGNLREPNERELQGVWNETIPDSATRQKVAMARAIENIQREPLLFLARLRYKTMSLWQLDTRLFAANAPIGSTLDESSLAFALASDAEYVLLLLCALVGIVVVPAAARSPTLIGWTLYGTLLSAVSLGHPRLRLPLLAMVFVYAAYPLAHPQRVWLQLKQASLPRRAALGAGVVALAILLYAGVYIPFFHSQFWLLMARVQSSTHTEHTIQQAIAANPTHYLPYVALGDWQQQQGNAQQALVAYQAAAKRAPQNTTTYLRLIAAQRQLAAQAAQAAQNDTLSPTQQHTVTTAMQAIAAVGWDNNQLYTWAWQHIPTTCGSRLDVRLAIVGMLKGVSALTMEQHDTRPFRWTLDTTYIRFAPTNHLKRKDNVVQLHLIMRADKQPTPVTVHAKGIRSLTSIVGTTWQQVDVVLVAPPADEPLVVALHMPTHVASSAEPYPRGIALAAAWLEE